MQLELAKRPDWDTYFLNIAQAVSLRATCPRKRVGAVLVSDNRIVSVGYNGAPSNQPHCIDYGCIMVDGHCKRTNHAEINAINFASVEKMKYPMTMYTTIQPCDVCREFASGYGVDRFVYLEEGR